MPNAARVLNVGKKVMPTRTATLHLLCGKIASGKSTLAAKLAASDGALLIAEDDWLAALFPEELAKPKDYLRCSTKLRRVMAPHIRSILKSGLSVVLDFQANTVESRLWMLGLVEGTGAAHQVHVLTSPDEVCLARLRQRNADGDHPFSVSEEQFHQITRYFVPPTAEEGCTLVFHDRQLPG